MGEVFQGAISQILETIDGCKVIADDILIWGYDKEEHNRRLCAALERIRQANMKINDVGHTFGPNGLKPSLDKLRAIMEIQEPQNRTELQRFMGTVNYLGKFTPNLSGINHPLRQLFQKYIAWH